MPKRTHKLLRKTKKRKTRRHRHKKYHCTQRRYKRHLGGGIGTTTEVFNTEPIKNDSVTIATSDGYVGSIADYKEHMEKKNTNGEDLY
jgi:hypothetical protein